MQRYFVEEKYSPLEKFPLTGEAFHHIVRVMRMTPQQKIFVVFSDGVSIVGEIIEITEDTVWLKELYQEISEKEMPVAFTIASGFPKGDKLEWVVQKATELGAASFIGFPAKTSVVKWDEKKLHKKQQRLEKIAQEAAEQSQRQQRPTVSLLTKETAFFAELPKYDHVLVAYEESAKLGEQSHLAQLLKNVQPGEKVLAIFGPEGGLTPDEIKIFEEQGAILCGLGPRILRTETAPLYLLSAASFYLELM